MRPDGGSRHPVNLDFFVAPRSVNIAIGPKGSIISETEKDTGTSVSFEKRDEIVCGTSVRLCSVGGPTVENVIAALKTIWAADDNFLDARIALKDALVALVIGKSGSMIKEIQEQTGANLSFCKPHEMGQLERHMRALTIKGSDAAICQTVALVLELIQEKGHEVMSGNQVQHVRPEFVPLNPPFEPQFETRPVQRFSDLRPVQRFEPQTVAVKPMPRFESSSVVRGEFTEDFFIMPEIVRLAIGKAGATINRIQQDSGSKVSFSKEDENVNGILYRRMTITGRSLNIAAAATLVGKLDEGHETCAMLLLPDTSVSFIIGSNGTSIKNITQNTRAFLSFAKPEEMGFLQGRDRILHVKGTPEQVHRALDMVITLNHDCVARGEKRPEVGQMTASGPKKAKWGSSPGAGDGPVAGNVVLILPKALADIDWMSIQSTYCVSCNIQEDSTELAVVITGDNAISAQTEIQSIIQSRTNGSVQWRVTAI